MRSTQPLRACREIGCSLDIGSKSAIGSRAVDLEHSLPWLALRLTPGLGARLAGKLLRQFGSPEEIFRASLTELGACQLPAAVAQAVLSNAAFRPPRKQLTLAPQ